MRTIVAVLAIALLAGPVPALAQETAGWDGLVEVRSPRFDAGFVAPGADFRGYTKIMVDRPEVAFRNNWQRDVNSSRRGSRRVSDQQAAEILAAARTNFTDIFEEAFRAAGFAIADAPGPDVMRVSPAIMNIVINAPDTQTSGRTRSFTANAGQATLLMEVRDSETNALMARVLDRRETRQMPGQANSITNAADFRQLFRSWSRSAVEGLEGLKAISPVPDPLTPGQRLN